MTTIVLVRHGETEWNRAGRWQGHADVPLSPIGRQQARLLADHLQEQGVRFDHVYASDLGRALETAQIVAAALRVPVHPLIELREMHIGGWSGLTSAEIRAAHPDQWALREAGGDFQRGGHGETWAAFCIRIGKVLDHLVTTHPNERLLIVTHGGSIRALLQHLRPFAEGDGDFHIDNTSVTEVVVDHGTAKIVRANDLAHLSTPADPDLVSDNEAL